MNRKTRSLLFICCIIAAIAIGTAFGSGSSLNAAGTQSASAGEAVTEDISATEEDDDLVIIEVQDEETPAADIRVTEEGPSYLGLAVCLGAAAAALLIAILVLGKKYGQLKQETRRLEDEVAQMYAKHVR